MLKKLCFILLNSGSADGNGPAVTPQALQTANQINDPQTGRVELPPAAAVVKDAETTEEVLNLRKKNQELEGRAKKAETDAAHLADENHRLKAAGVTGPGIPPAPPKDTRSALEKWFNGEEV